MQVEVDPTGVVQALLLESVSATKLGERTENPRGQLIGLMAGGQRVGRITVDEVAELADVLEPIVDHVRITMPSDGTLLGALESMFDFPMTIPGAQSEKWNTRLEEALEAIDDGELEESMLALFRPICDVDGRSARGWSFEGPDIEAANGDRLRFVAGLFDGEGVGFAYDVYQCDPRAKATTDPFLSGGQ